MKKILILYTSIGWGHKIIAENIGYHLQQAGFQVRLEDTHKVQSGFMAKWGTALHQFLHHHLPFVWEWLYAVTQKPITNFSLPQRVKVAAKNYQKVWHLVQDFQPDLIITTQTTASAIIEYLKQTQRYTGLWTVVFSDYHLHRYWLYPHADYYFANIEEQKQQMVKLGIPADSIIVAGMTLKPKPLVDNNQIKAQLGIASNQPVIIMANGSMGIGLTDDWLIALAQEATVQKLGKVIIACGNNVGLKERLEQKLNDPDIVVLGYYSPFAELYSIADLLVSKPGGLTMAETLQWSLPMLVTHLLPGGEGLNYDYLAENRLIMTNALFVKPQALAQLIRSELESRSFRRQLAGNPKRAEVVQENREGQVIIQAVKNMFHPVRQG